MNKKHPNLPVSNIEALHKMFADFILDSRNVGKDGRQTSYLYLRHTFIFKDGSRLYIREQLTKDGFIETYHYDWEDENGNIILKFHSEPHPDDPRYQTDTEPFHVHPPDDAKLTNRTRYPNYYHRNLYGILEFIALFLIANKKI